MGVSILVIIAKLLKNYLLNEVRYKPLHIFTSTRHITINFLFSKVQKFQSQV